MTRSFLSPLRPFRRSAPLLDPEPAAMKSYAVSFTARAALGQPPRPITLTVWALGATMAILLARRQTETLGLTDVSPMRWSAL